MKDVSKFYGHSVFFVAIWYILWSFWYIISVLVSCTTKNLATLAVRGMLRWTGSPENRGGPLVTHFFLPRSLSLANNCAKNRQGGGQCDQRPVLKNNSVPVLAMPDLS
jgi:hypothetical protein